MAKWLVTLPVARQITVEVEGESSEDAICAALSSDEITIDNLEEWEAMRHIVQGNVFYGCCAHASAEQIEGYDEE